MPKPGGFTLKNRYGTFAKECTTLKGIINKISSKHRVVPEEVEQILDHYHKWVCESISSETAPNVHIPNFGRFTISSVKLRMRIKIAIENYRKGIYSYEKTCQIIKRFWPLYKRANAEELFRGRGVNKKTGEKVKMSSLMSKRIKKKMRKNWNSL